MNDGEFLAKARDIVGREPRCRLVELDGLIVFKSHPESPSPPSYQMLVAYEKNGEERYTVASFGTAGKFNVHAILYQLERAVQRAVDDLGGGSCA